MSMLGVTGVAVNDGAGLGRLRREVHSGVVDTDSTPDVQIITPLEHFFSKHRAVKALVPFTTLNPSCRKHFYDKAADCYMERGGETLAYFTAAESVARELGLVIASCDRSTVHQSIRNRVIGKKKLMEIVACAGESAIVASPPAMEVFDDNVVVVGDKKSSANRRR